MLRRPRRPAAPPRRRRPAWSATTTRSTATAGYPLAWRLARQGQTEGPGAERQGSGAKRQRPRPERRRHRAAEASFEQFRLARRSERRLRNSTRGRVRRRDAGRRRQRQGRLRRVSAAALDAAVNGDSADLAIAPLDALIADPQASAVWRERAPFIAKLGGEPIEIIAARDVADLRQLAGREVGFGVADSADATSGAALFNALGVAPRPAYEPLADALNDLAAGRLAAVVAVDGRCAPTLAQFGADRRFHQLAVRWTPALRSVYAPARLTAKDRPNLIDAEERIDPVAAPRALIALDAAPGSPRAQAAAALTKTFFEGFDRLLVPDRTAPGATSILPPRRRGRACARRRNGSTRPDRLPTRRCNRSAPPRAAPPAPTAVRRRRIPIVSSTV